MSITFEELVDRITRLEDLEAIRRIVKDLRRHLDEYDHAAFSALFSGTGTFVAFGAEAMGPDAIEKLLNSRRGSSPSGAPGHHVIWDPVIDLGDGSAKAATTWGYVAEGSNDAASVTRIGYYDDRFSKLDGRWYISSREAIREIPSISPVST